MCYNTHYHFKVSADEYGYKNVFYDINRLYAQKQIRF